MRERGSVKPISLIKLVLNKSYELLRFGDIYLLPEF